MTGIPAVGEADCKLPRWVDYVAGLHPSCAVDVVVEATDSDYILIAMLHYERQCMHVAVDGAGLGRVSLRRMRCSGLDAKPAAASAAKASSSAAAQKKKSREMEYINIPLLSEVMDKLMRVLFEGGTPMRCLTALVAFGGTDFCRNTPRLGPRRLWDLLPQVLHKTKADLFKHRATDDECPEVVHGEPTWEVLNEARTICHACLQVPTTPHTHTDV